MALPQQVANIGRESTLTPEVHDAIVSAVKLGNYESVAYRSAGVKESTFFKWKQKGNASIEREDDDIYAQLVQDINLALAFAETDGVSELRHHGKRSYTATIEFLARRYPQRWGKQDKVQIDATVHMPTVPMADLTLDTKRQILADLEAKAQLVQAEPVLELTATVVDSDSDEGD